MKMIPDHPSATYKKHNDRYMLESSVEVRIGHSLSCTFIPSITGMLPVVKYVRDRSSAAQEVASLFGSQH